MAERVPYFELTAAEQQALHDWCALHGVDHTRVPVDARLEIDPATGEWLIDTISALLLFGAIGDGNADLGLPPPAEASNETLKQEAPRPTLALVDDLDAVTALARHGH